MWYCLRDSCYHHGERRLRPLGRPHGENHWYDVSVDNICVSFLICISYEAFSQIASTLLTSDISSTGADVPMPYAVPLEKLALPQLDDILTVVKRVVNRKL